MSIVTKLATWLMWSAFLLAAATLNSSAYAYEISGITPSSEPQFVNNVTIRANRGNWTISGHRDFIFNDGTNTWDGSALNYRLTATFDSAGDFVSGSVELFGKIDGLGVPRTLLTSADLTSFGTDLLQPNLLGFNTDNIYCDPGLGVMCTQSESVYIVLDSPLVDSGFNVNGRIRTSGVAVTSVPLPAAALLFLSGLGLIGAVGRHRSNAG
jgi:hypothetical protein